MAQEANDKPVAPKAGDMPVAPKADEVHIELDPETRKFFEELTAFLGDAVKLHAPPQADLKWARKQVAQYIYSDEPLDMIVLSADIKSSTALMKESISARKHADAITAFVDGARHGIHTGEGWFDKFMGDGFLAYWFYDEKNVEKQVEEAIQTAGVLHSVFYSRAMSRFRANVKNMPGNAGLTVGIDMGKGHFARVAGHLTIIGAPVVGAVRMNACATQAWETICNTQVVGHLGESQKSGFLNIERVLRKTKEYEIQEVYSVTFPVSKNIPKPGDR